MPSGSSGIGKTGCGVRGTGCGVRETSCGVCETSCGELAARLLAKVIFVHLKMFYKVNGRRLELFNL